jgi:putative membrane protein
MGVVAVVLGVLLFLGLLILLGLVIVWVVRQSRRGGTGTEPPVAEENPLEVARRRLAAGEITIEEFETIRDRLED